MHYAINTPNMVAVETAQKNPQERKVRPLIAESTMLPRRDSRQCRAGRERTADNSWWRGIK